jgi:hypothetical protein
MEYKRGAAKSQKEKAPALREFKVETAQGETGARMEGFGLENVEVRGL